MRPPLKTLLLLLLFSCYFSVLQGQQPVMRQFTAADGLPGGTVYITIQDQQGYIWIGTDRGVVRFDGNNFKIFTVKDGLPSNEVWGISEDKSGKLWLDTFNGICYIEEGKVHHLAEEYFPKARNQTSHLFTSAGHYIILDHRYLFYLPEGGNPINVTDKTKQSLFLNASNHVITEEILQDSTRQRLRKKYRLLPNQKLLFINETTLIDTEDYFTSKHKELTLTSVKNPTNLKKIKISSISKDEMFVLYDGRISRLDNNGLSPISTEQLFKEEEKNININLIKKIIPNLIWIKTNKGNFIVDSLLRPNIAYDFLYDIPINNIFLDKQENLWLSTSDGLLFISQAVQNSRSYLINSKNKSNSFNFLTINEKEDIWCLNADGYLYYLDVKKGLSPFLNIPIMNVPTDLSFDFDNNLWVSGSRLSKIPAKDLYEESLNSNEYKIQTLDSRCSRAVKNIHFLDREKYLISSFNCFAEIYQNNAEYVSALNDRYYGIAVLDHEHFVVSGKFGIRKILRKEGALALDSISTEADHSILHLPINTITTGNDKAVWLAVNNIGVYRWDGPQLDSIIELSNVLVESLYMDTEQRLWACTNEGLAKIYNIKSNPFSYDFQWFRTKNGLISNDVKAVLTQGNKVTVGTNKGITIFNEESKGANITMPFRFIGLQVNGQQRSLKNKYELSHRENNLLIKYECLDYKNLGNKIFQYKLVGVDEHWIDNTNFEKEYASLSPGDYTFLLRRKPDVNSEILPTELSLFLSIKPPFWKTAWFSLLVLSMLSVLVYLLYQNQIRKIEARSKATNELNKKFAELELNALQSQMNPHFVFNALNAIQDFIFKNDTRDANRYLVKFSRLMRLILESSKEKTILLEDEIQLLQLYIDLEVLRFEDKFKSEINVGDNFSPALISIPSMLLQPFVENAINHGLTKASKPGKLLLEFSVEGKVLHCKIEDNGIGINKSQEKKKNSTTGHKSRGMQMVRERQRVWNIIGDTSVKIDIQDLFNEQNGTSGTRVDIYITLEQFENDPKN